MNKNQLVIDKDKRVYVPADSAQSVVPNSQSDDNDDEIDLRELFLVLRKRIFLIILIAALVFMAAFVVTLSIEPTYRATTKIQIQSEESGQVLNFDVALGDGGNDEFYQTQYELLKSYKLAADVIKELGLEDEFNAAIPTEKGMFSRVIDYFKTLLFWKEKSADYALGAYPAEEHFLAGLTVSPVKKSQIVQISYDHNDPDLARRIVDTVASNFIKMTLQRRLDAAKDAQKFLDVKVEQASNDLEALEQKLANYAKAESIIQVNGESSQSLSAQKTAELNLAYTIAQGERIEAEARYRELSSSQGVVSALENPALQALRSKVVELQSEYQKNLQKYKPGYPYMISLRRQINQFTNQIEQETLAVKRAARSTLQAVYSAAKEKEESLRQSLEQQKSTLLAERDKGIEYGDILRQVSIQRKVYEELLLRATEVSIAAGIGNNNVSIVDAAILPYEAQAPNIKMNLMLGGVLGLMLGVMTAFLLEFLSTGIKSTEELKRILGLPLLGIVPMVKERNPASHFLITVNKPSSAIAEAFRSIRTNLLFSSVGGVPKVISVTSTLPSEGKSSTCMHIAMAFASSGKRVLLVEADMRKPVVHKHLKLDNSLGLSNYLSHQADIDEVLQDTVVDGISVVTSGPIPPNPSELLSSDRLSELFSLVPERFDLVIFDSPPVIGIADALVIANSVQATILVAGFDMADRRAVVGAVERLKQARANLLGVLFTKVKSGAGYSSYYGDVYQYEYGNQQLPNR